MTKLQYILKATQLNENSIKNTLSLLDEDATIPFISRYRKEQTGGLDEVKIGLIVKHKLAFEELEKRKQTILKAIEEQGQLTDVLRDKIEKTSDLAILEDIYLPYKKKRKTKASVARELGLEPLAKIIMAQQDNSVESSADRFVKGDVSSIDKALEGARFIIAEWINENEYVRKKIRRLYSRKASIKSTIIKSKKEEESAQKYQQYFDWEEPLYKTPSHRLLAILRAEKEGFVRVKIEADKEEALDMIDDTIIKNNASSSCSDQIFKAGEDAYKRLLQPAIANEILKEAKLKADEKAIEVFSNNLRQLLLASPLGEKRVLAIDPGFKSGCKVVCLDEKGDLKHNENIYPHPPQREVTPAIKKIKSLVNAYKIEAIAIGNGTASRETEAFIKKIAFTSDIQVFVVNEAGASVYSASKVAREEFPNYDVTVRGAVSIGRRLSDPLAELVKIDPKSIGVGQYQHDVDQTLLKNELDTVVMSCVNTIGVNVNTASAPLLSYVSGIGKTIAENIVAYRTKEGSIQSRAELKKVPRLGNKAFEQSAGFFRIRDGKNPLDNSAVHPERYQLVEQITKDLGITLSNLIANKDAISKINKQKYITDEVGLPTLEDIIKELEKPGVDPREKARVFEFAKDITKIEDLKAGMKLPGLVNNITNFGCFVDIGIKQSGLVHISKLANKFVSDPNEVVKLNQQVMVTVVEVDLQRKRIQLSMID
ncbi:Tex family protein [Pseudofulvibacter geojedonensis]|uniref:Tex family protein n=1 Tax=Pseudofulvibacter geojedonensis TaxID=1123758 RepID=A0ABW3I437_9FLAO